MSCMFKRTILSILSIFVLSVMMVSAQTIDLQRKIERGISLYEFSHFSAARAELLSAREGLSSIHDSKLIERIDYYVALCDVALKNREVESRLKKFMADYPGSTYTNDMPFALGVHYCVEGDVAAAEEQMSQVNYKRLDTENQDRYNLRMGYMAFMKEDYPAAKEYFGKIGGKGDYAEHALYYNSYMAYAEGDLVKAREGFSALKSSAQYRDLMPHYIMQIDFKEGKYRAVVEGGDALIATSAHTQAQQIRRMMSESWFQLSDYASAVKYMEA